jgi:hypothetical protein
MMAFVQTLILNILTELIVLLIAKHFDDES